VLRHEFVVLSLAKTAASKDDSAFERVLSLKPKLAVLPKRLALAAWVTRAKNLQPVQALGGWLPLTSFQNGGVIPSK